MPTTDFRTRINELHAQLEAAQDVPEHRVISGRLVDALLVVAELHAPDNVEEYCPATFGDPCPDAHRVEHRDLGNDALVHTGIIVRRECTTCRDDDNQPAKHPCNEYRRVFAALDEPGRDETRHRI